MSTEAEKEQERRKYNRPEPKMTVRSLGDGEEWRGVECVGKSVLFPVEENARAVHLQLPADLDEEISRCAGKQSAVMIALMRHALDVLRRGNKTLVVFRGAEGGVVRKRDAGKSRKNSILKEEAK